jgi:hypothetical protein
VEEAKGDIGSVRDKVLMGVLGLLWFSLVLYSNYTQIVAKDTPKETVLLEK